MAKAVYVRVRLYERGVPYTALHAKCTRPEGGFGSKSKFLSRKFQGQYEAERSDLYRLIQSACF